MTIWFGLAGLTAMDGSRPPVLTAEPVASTTVGTTKFTARFDRAATGASLARAWAGRRASDAEVRQSETPAASAPLTTIGACLSAGELLTGGTGGSSRRRQRGLATSVPTSACHRMPGARSAYRPGGEPPSRPMARVWDGRRASGLRGGRQGAEGGGAAGRGGGGEYADRE